MEVRLFTLTCKRCGHKWIPRITEVKECPKCQSPKWNEAKEDDDDQ